MAVSRSLITSGSRDRNIISRDIRVRPGLFLSLSFSLFSFFLFLSFLLSFLLSFSFLFSLSLVSFLICDAESSELSRLSAHRQEVCGLQVPFFFLFLLSFLFFLLFFFLFLPLFLSLTLSSFFLSL